MKYRWKFKPTPNDETIQKLSSHLNIPKTLSKVLVTRGVETIETAERFFKPSMSDLYDPFLMKNMDIAVERVLKAIREGESIWIHGDYDVDGTSSTAIILQFLRDIGAKVEYYIPDRFHEGYGLSINSIDLALSHGVSLLITVDVGITSYEPLAHAQDKQLDTIICDHHEPGDFIPEVYAILDPLQPGCEYPFKHLAACGVAFKLIQGIAQKMNIPDKANEYLDFVAVASAADMVPLIDENRTLVYYGLELLNSKTRPGFKGLIACTNLKMGQITASNIVFALAPLINAAGRMGNAVRSVEMMIQKDENAAFRIAQQLEDENRKRRVFDAKTFEEAIPMAEKQIHVEKRRSLVIHNPHWHAGVIGIVASRLVDKFNLPTILMTTIDGLAKGSARSINNFDIHTALKSCAHLLTEFGGHKHAAGLSLDESNIPEFSQIIDSLAQKVITQDMMVPEILIDAEMKFNELSPNFMEFLDSFAPYGFSNTKPIFYSKGVTSVNGVKIVGNNSLKFRAFQSNFVIDAIGYNLADKYKFCTNGKKFSLLYTIEVNNYNGLKSPQISIKDIKPE